MAVVWTRNWHIYNWADVGCWRCCWCWGTRAPPHHHLNVFFCIKSTNDFLKVANSIHTMMRKRATKHRPEIFISEEFDINQRISARENSCEKIEKRSWTNQTQSWMLIFSSSGWTWREVSKCKLRLALKLQNFPYWKNGKLKWWTAILRLSIWPVFYIDPIFSTCSNCLYYFVLLIYPAEYSDWQTNLDDLVKVLAPHPLAHQDEGGDDKIDEGC